MKKIFPEDTAESGRDSKGEDTEEPHRGNTVTLHADVSQARDTQQEQIGPGTLPEGDSHVKSIKMN